MDGWMDGWMDGLMANGCIELNTCPTAFCHTSLRVIAVVIRFNRMNWIDGWMDGWMDGTQSN